MPAAKKTSPSARTAANKVPAKKAAAAKKTAVKTTARPPLASKTVQVTSPLSSLPAANQLEYFSQLLQEIYDAAIDPARW